METIWSCFEQLDKIPRHGTGHKDSIGNGSLKQ